MRLSLYARPPLFKRVHRLETDGIKAYLRRLSDDELRSVYRRMAAQSEGFARQLRERGYWEQVFGPEEEENRRAGTPQEEARCE